MRTSKLLGVVCAGFVALAMGAPHAGASTLTTPGGLGQPKLQPGPSPTVEQKNINVPISVLNTYDNNGDVTQTNNVGTSSGSDQGPKQDGNQYGSVEKVHQCNCDQSYGPKHDGDKDRGDKNRGDKDRKGDKDGNNCRCDNQGPKHDGYKDRGDKNRDDKNRGDKNRGDQYGHDKYQGNKDGNSCRCDNQGPKKPEGDYGRDKDQGNQGGNYPAPKPEGDYGRGEQVNVNVPISVLNTYDNNGDVDQYNNVGSSSYGDGGGNYPAPTLTSDYGRDKYQGNDGGNSCRCDNQGPKPEGDYGRGKQVNINAPISVLNTFTNNGDVDQYNNVGSSSNGGGGSYGGGGGNPMPPTGGIPIVGSLLG